MVKQIYPAIPNKSPHYICKYVLKSRKGYFYKLGISLIH